MVGPDPNCADNDGASGYDGASDGTDGRTTVGDSSPGDGTEAGPEDMAERCTICALSAFDATSDDGSVRLEHSGVRFEAGNPVGPSMAALRCRTAR
jgi:hypothetical protein